MFSHEKLQGYHRATKWLAISAELLSGIPKGNAELVSQLRRAALSIPLNIAEGAGKSSEADKKRYYSIARGSSLECAAILDAMKILELGDLEDIKRGKKLLEEIASMLTALVFRWKQSTAKGKVQVHANAKGS